MPNPKVVFAGDRDISVWVLKYLLEQNIRPRVLWLSEPDHASHLSELRNLCNYLDENTIFVGRAFREESAQEFLMALELDYIICIHFPYVIPKSILDIPRYGVLNLHPAYLPYNRGWHTPSWALLDQTPIGATLHFMDAGIDSGDVVYQRQLLPSSGDTAHSLYSKLKHLEFEVFKEIWPSIAVGNYQRIPQRHEEGTVHKRAELFSPKVQEIELDTLQTPRELLRKLRALTTNSVDEAAYFREGEKTYRIQVTITED
ncbi:MAG: hypothetical protein DPW16_11105 [Chloroflexi bacterium]|nr:hypothetical protein [Chloroflexota bacterium]